MPTKRFLKVWGILCSVLTIMCSVSPVRLAPDQFMMIVGFTGLLTVALSYPVRRAC